jgi:cell division protein FtsL
MSRQSETPKQAKYVRKSPAQRTWSELIKPALIIAAIGAGAVLYLVACARISVIECDLQRLERACARQEAAELELQRQLASLQSPDRVQQHIVEHGLEPPTGIVHVALTDVPPSLQQVLPVGGEDSDTREIMLGQLPGGSQAPLHASSRLIASAQTE